jgi:hypothetical protein
MVSSICFICRMFRIFDVFCTPPDGRSEKLIFDTGLGHYRYTQAGMAFVREWALRPDNVVDLSSPRGKPGSGKPHHFWIPAFAGMTLEA